MAAFNVASLLRGRKNFGLTIPGQDPAMAPNPEMPTKTSPMAGLPQAMQGGGLSFLNQPTAAAPNGVPDLPANYGFNDLAGYEEARRRQFGQDAGKTIMDQGGALESDLNKQYDARRAALATSLTDQGKQTFDLQNPQILEDLNNRGVFSSPTAVANAQAQAMKEIALANGQQLNQFDTQRLQDMTGLQKEYSGASTNAQLQGGQDALDAGLNLRTGQLESSLQQSQADREAALARDLARKQQSSSLTNSLIGAGGSILANGGLSMLGKGLGALGGGGTAGGILSGVGTGQVVPGLGAVGTGAPAAAGGIGLGGAAAIGGAGLGAMALSQAGQNRFGTIGGVLANPIGYQLNGARTLIRNPGRTVSNAVGSVFCFDPMTPIVMADDCIQPIKSIVLGDMIKGGEVQSVRISYSPDGSMYDYKGVLVTGYHAVNENGRWIRIQDSSIAEPVPGSRIVVSLVTSDHRIFVNGIEFADEHETDHYEDLTMAQSLGELNEEDIVEVATNGI